MTDWSYREAMAAAQDRQIRGLVALMTLPDVAEIGRKLAEGITNEIAALVVPGRPIRDRRGGWIAWSGGRWRRCVRSGSYWLWGEGE